MNPDWSDLSHELSPASAGMLPQSRTGRHMSRDNLGTELVKSEKT